MSFLGFLNHFAKSQEGFACGGQSLVILTLSNLKICFPKISNPFAYDFLRNLQNRRLCKKYNFYHEGIKGTEEKGAKAQSENAGYI